MVASDGAATAVDSLPHEQGKEIRNDRRHGRTGSSDRGKQQQTREEVLGGVSTKANTPFTVFGLRWTGTRHKHDSLLRRHFLSLLPAVAVSVGARGAPSGRFLGTESKEEEKKRWVDTGGNYSNPKATSKRASGSKGAGDCD